VATHLDVVAIGVEVADREAGVIDHAQAPVLRGGYGHFLLHSTLQSKPAGVPKLKAPSLLPFTDSFGLLDTASP
jgi:hypothetical protein